MITDINGDMETANITNRGVCQTTFSPVERRVITISSLVTGIMSLYGTTFVMCIFMLLPKRSNKKRVRKMMYLAFYISSSEFIWAASNVVEKILILTMDKFYGQSQALMLLFRATFQFGALASIVWTNCVGFYLLIYLLTIKRLDTNIKWNRYFIAFHLMSWGLPLINVTVTIAIARMELNVAGYAAPIQPYHIYLWLLPVLASVLLCVILYISVIVVMRNLTYTPTNKKKHRAFILRILLFTFILLFWIPDVVAYCINNIYHVSTGEACNVFFLVVIYSILRNLQGLFDAFAYGFLIQKQLVKVVSKFWASSNIMTLTLVSGFAILSPILLLPIGIYSFLRCLSMQEENASDRSLLTDSASSPGYSSVNVEYSGEASEE